jgi:ubiquinone/menaquinone biosynthesis C-methylase UbiE
MIQDDYFNTIEGNNYYLRNNQDQNPNKELISLLKSNNVHISNLLDVGGFTGFQANALHDIYGCNCSVLEPSELALNEGKLKYPYINFKQGVANKILFGDEEFDLIIVNFVLHWIDRKYLLKSIAEMDRVLSNGGHILIGDFTPKTASKRKYHHDKTNSTWTYKQRYYELFLSSNLYSLIASIELPYDNSSRFGIYILKKQDNYSIEI